MLTLSMVQSEAARIGRALRVLVVEDSYLTARTISQMLRDFGAEVIGPAPSVSDALRLLDEEGCDAAVLDINLGSETAEPVAERLEESGRPFFFLSGYSSPKLMHARFKSRTLLAKPVERAVLWRTLQDTMLPPAAP